jgi:hypothetical protein
VSAPPAARCALDRDDLGFLLAKATQRWNELLAERFAAAGYGDVRPSYGSVLLPSSRRTGCAWASWPGGRG